MERWFEGVLKPNSQKSCDENFRRVVKAPLYPKYFQATGSILGLTVSSYLMDSWF